MANKPRKMTSKQAELAIAEEAFREALRGGDSAADAFLYAQLALDSAKLANG